MLGSISNQERSGRPREAVPTQRHLESPLQLTEIICTLFLDASVKCSNMSKDVSPNSPEGGNEADRAMRKSHKRNHASGLPLSIKEPSAGAVREGECSFTDIRSCRGLVQTFRKVTSWNTCMNFNMFNFYFSKGKTHLRESKNSLSQTSSEQFLICTNQTTHSSVYFLRKSTFFRELFQF